MDEPVCGRDVVLKCQFCSSTDGTFSSTYKIIPHIFFAHRKKLCKLVSKQQPVNLPCPANCQDFSYPLPQAPKGTPSDHLLVLVAKALVGLEDHINEVHTHEEKITRCPYCQVDLGDIIYYRHLEEHLFSGAGAPSPQVTPEKAVQPAVGVDTPADKPAEGNVECNVDDKQVAATSEPLGVPDPQSSDAVKSDANNDKDAPAKEAIPLSEAVSSQAEQVVSSDKSEGRPSDTEVLINEDDAKVDHEPESIPDDSKSPQKQVEAEENKSSTEMSIFTEKQANEMVEESIDISSKFEVSSPKTVEQEESYRPDKHTSGPQEREGVRRLSSSEYMHRLAFKMKTVAPVIETPAVPEEEKTTTPDDANSARVSSAPAENTDTPVCGTTRPNIMHDASPSDSGMSVPSVDEVSSTQNDQPTPAGSILSKPDSPPLSLKAPEELAADTIPFKSYFVRQMSTERKLSPQVSISPHDSESLQHQSDAVKPAASQIKMPSPSDAHTTARLERKQSHSLERKRGPTTPPEEESVVPVEASEAQAPINVGRSVSSTPILDKLMAPKLAHGDLTNSSIGSSTAIGHQSVSSGGGDKLVGRLSQPVTPNTEISPRSSGGATPHQPTGQGLIGEHQQRSRTSSGNSGIVAAADSRPQSAANNFPHHVPGDGHHISRSGGSSRRVSGDKERYPSRRQSSDHPPSTYTRPVLTQELENQIIYGDAFLKKGKDHHRPSLTSLLTSGDKRSEAIDDTDAKSGGIKRSSAVTSLNRDKMSRMEKLAQVRQEIELRFQEEEKKRMLEKEAQRKRIEEEQEKLRKEEERQRQERERIAAEKRRQKAEKRKGRDRGRRHNKKEADEDEDEDEDKDDEEHVEKEELMKKRIKGDEKSSNASPLSEDGDKVSPKTLSRNVGTRPLSSAIAVERTEMEDDDDDDLEAMMRQYREKEQRSQHPAPTSEKTINSLAFLMDSYSKDDGSNRKRERSGSDGSPEPPAKTSKASEDKSSEPIAINNQVQDLPVEDVPMRAEMVPVQAEDTSTSRPRSRSASSMDLGPYDDPDSSRTIPRGFDKYGHPLDQPKIRVAPKTAEELEEEAAAKKAAEEIMPPAKRSKELKAASQLVCSLCKLEGFTGGNYYSAYQLLSHVFLAHRKKIISRSRKMRSMTLSCPEGCGFITPVSKEETSIDYYTHQLPVHLESLCEHTRDCHTGEPKMECCQYCSFPLQADESWSWQHLANHRDPRRYFCKTCNNFPFKNEVHKCPGTGVETSYDQEEKEKRDGDGTRRPAGSDTDLSRSKSLAELAREVEEGHLDPEVLVNRKNLGNLERFICLPCDKYLPQLSVWLQHVRTEHLQKCDITHVNSLRCFCCPWVPQRFESDRAVIGVNSLMDHLLTNHHSEAWEDKNFQLERNRFTLIQKDVEKRLEREKEEARLQVPRLPVACSTCEVMLRTERVWRYHYLAHKFGEVYCSSCNNCILGYLFESHANNCRKGKVDPVRSSVEKDRNDTWVIVADKKFKILFSSERSKQGSTIVAKSFFKGRPFKAFGSNRDAALARMREDLEGFVRHMNQEEFDKKRINKDTDQEDKEKLISLFQELAKVDKENEGLVYMLCVDGAEKEVATSLHISRRGHVQIVAAVELDNCAVLSEFGGSRREAVQKLSEKVRVELPLSPPQTPPDQEQMEVSLDIDDKSTTVTLSSFEVAELREHSNRASSMPNGTDASSDSEEVENLCAKCGARFASSFLFQLHKRVTCGDARVEHPAEHIIR